MARVEGNSVIIETDWPGIKNQIDARDLNFRFEETDTAYEIFAIDGQYIYTTIIYKSGQAPDNPATYDTWRTEFEADYQNKITDIVSTSPSYLTNVDGYSIILKDGSTPTANDGYGIATIGTDGSNYRMARMDSSGRQIIAGAGTAGTPAGGVITIQGDPSGTPLPVSATFSNTDIVATGNITGSGQSITTLDLNGIGTAAVQITGTWTATLQFEGSVDGTNYVNVNVRGTNTNTISTNTTANGLFRVGIAGLRNFRIRCSAFTSGTATITIRQTSETSAIYLHESIPTGNAVIGAVTGSGTFTVNASATVGIVDNAAFTDGTTRIQPVGFIFDETAGTALTENDGAAARIDSKRAQVITIEDATTRGQRLTITASNAMKVDGSEVTQPISAASLPLPTGAATESTLSTLLLDSTFTSRINTLGQKTMANSTPITIASDQSAITITGTVTANNPSVGSNNSAIPSSSTQIGGSDGTNLQAARVFDLDTGGGQQWILGVGLRKASGGGSVELGTSSDPIRIDPTGTTAQPASQSGAWTVAATQSGTWTVQPGNTANTTPWLATINQGGNSVTVTGSNALKVDGSAVTQPVSGTITANAGTGDFTVVQSTASNLNAQVVGPGASGAALSGNPIRVAGSDGTNTRNLFTDTSGRLIVIGGAANGAAATGNPVLIAGSDGTNARSIRTATDGTIRVDPTGTTTQPVSGTVAATQSGAWTVTANAGTGNFTVIGTATDNTANSTAKLPVIAARANTAAPSWSDGNMVPLSTDLTGALRITGSISATNPSVGANNAAIPTSSTQIGGSDGTNLQAARVFDGDTGGGTQYILGVGLRKFASGGTVELGTSADPIRIDPTGTTTQPISGTVTANQGGTWNITNISGTISLPTGAATEATLSAISGKLPAALVGGRLDTNNGAWLGSTAPTVGQKTMANSIPVVVASDQSTLPTKEIRTATTSVTSVTSAAVNTTILASNANRLGATIQNDANKTLYLKLGSTASTTSYTVKMVKDSYYEVPYGYTGVITGIWDASPTGSARVTELT